MKQYIKEGKIYNLPISIIKNGKLIITNDEELILLNGYTLYELPLINTEININVLITESDNNINEQTDRKILNLFEFKNNLFYLTIENQTNFANMFIARDYLTFPQVVKTRNGFYEIKDKFECEEFYLSGINFVKYCIEEGWQRKAKAAELIKATYAEKNS